jgi:hypothetical protein
LLLGIGGFFILSFFTIQVEIWDSVLILALRSEILKGVPVIKLVGAFFLWGIEKATRLRMTFPKPPESVAGALRYYLSLSGQKKVLVASCMIWFVFSTTSSGIPF